MQNPVKIVEGEVLAQGVARRAEAEAIIAKDWRRSAGWTGLVAAVLSVAAFTSMGDGTWSLPLKVLLSVGFGLAVTNFIDIWMMQRRLDAVIYLLKDRQAR